MAFLKKGFSLVVILCCVMNCAYCYHIQSEANPDSLLKKAALFSDPSEGIKLAESVLQTAKRKNDEWIVIKGLNIISGFYYDLRDYKQEITYAQKALLEAKTFHADSLSGDSWLYWGMADYGLGNFLQSIEHYKKSAVIFKNTNQQSGLAAAYLNIGISERKLSKYNEALRDYILASDIYENLKYIENLSYTYNSIAGCYDDLHNYKKSLEYNKKALTIRLKLGKNGAISQSLNNIGFVFYKEKKPDSALHYLTKSLDIIKQQKDSSAFVLILQNIGASWKMKGNFQKAENYIKRSLQIASKYAMTEEIARGNVDMSEIYFRQKKYSQAIAAIDKTIGIATQLKLQELLLEAYTTKYNIYKQMGDYKNAVLYGDKKSELNDALFTISSNRAIAEMETKYKTTQTEKDRDAYKVQSELRQKIVSQQTKYIIALSFAAILLAVLFVVAYNNFRKKNKANQRIQTLMQDLHHRVKNNLQILSGLFTMQIDNLSDENTKNALRENEARLTSMNLIHNKLYLDNTTTKIEMNDYLTKLLNHIKDSFGGYKQSEINLRIEVSNIMLEADKAVAIGLIANELTTNAFKYAFNGQVHGEIHLALQLVEKSKILLTLGDNGVGLKAENKDKAPSFGLKLVNLMARQLNATLVVNNDNGVFYQMEISI